jgi:hypothetical protein
MWVSLRRATPKRAASSAVTDLRPARQSVDEPRPARQSVDEPAARRPPAAAIRDDATTALPRVTTRTPEQPRPRPAEPRPALEPEGSRPAGRTDRVVARGASAPPREEPTWPAGRPAERPRADDVQDPASPALVAAPAPQPRERHPLASLLLLVAGTGAAGAATQQWSVLATSDERRVFTGLTVGDGRITLVLGLVLALLAVARLARRRLTGADGATAAVIAVVLLVLTGFDLEVGPPALSSFRGISADKIVVQPQTGLYASVGAAVVGLLAALVLARADRAERAAPPPEANPAPDLASRAGRDHRAGGGRGR